MSNPCTCGVKFTGGLCSSWCDSLRPAEPEPAAERGKPHFNPMFLTHFYAPPQAVPVWPGYNMGPQPAAPTPGKPQATPFGDGTHADDELCSCGCYIMRPNKNYFASDSSIHGTRACCDAYGKVLTAPKP
jgi:hypothetical protein